MELMLIVWLVSILSNIKLFVSTYTVVCVCVVAAVYLLSKVSVSRIKYAIVPRHWVADLAEGQSFEIKEGSFHLEGNTTPLGVYVAERIYRSSGRIWAKHVESNERFILDLGKVRLHLTPDTPPVADENPAQYAAPLRTSGYVAIGMIVASVLLPSDTTMKYMAGAYLVQSVYESDLVQSTAPIARDAVKNQLKLWAKDTPDMDVLVRQAEQAASAVKVVENVGPTSSTPKK